MCWIPRRRISDEDNERLPPIKGQLTSAPLPLPNTKGSAGEKAASATTTVGATPMTQSMRAKEGGESDDKKLNTEVQDREAEVRSRGTNLAHHDLKPNRG